MPGYQEVRTLSTNTLSLHQPSARLRVLAFSFPRIDHAASHPLVIGASPIPLPAAVSITLLDKADGHCPTTASLPCTCPPPGHWSPCVTGSPHALLLRVRGLRSLASALPGIRRWLSSTSLSPVWTAVPCLTSLSPSRSTGSFFYDRLSARKMVQPWKPVCALISFTEDVNRPIPV